MCLAALGAFAGAGDGWIVELDAERGTIDEVAHISPPAELAVPGKGLTGLAWLPDGRLAVSAAAGVFLLHGGRVQQTWAMPSFNDLHGLAHYRDRVYLVNTGLDAIGVLVAVHEFGHYWVARKLGVKVLRFSIGRSGSFSFSSCRKQSEF